MASRLQDIQPDEVSLVHRGANRRRFLLAKSDTGELDGDIAQVLAAPADREQAFLKAVRDSGGDESVEKAAATVARGLAAIRDAYADKDAPVEALLKAARKQMDSQDIQDMLDGGSDEDEEGEPAGPSDEQEEVAKALVEAEQKIYKREFTAAERQALAAKGHALPDGSYPIESKADLGPAVTLAQSGHGDAAAAKNLISRRARELGATDELPESFNKEATDMTDTATVPVKKEDGTWDLSGVPEDQRAAVEAVIKSNEDEVAELRKAAEAEKSKADEAIEIAKAERDTRETREFVAKSAEYNQLAKSDDEFGAVLKSIASAEREGHLPEGTGSKLNEVLKAANEQVAKGDLFAEQGRAGHGAGSSDHEAKVKTAVAEIRKSDPDLTDAQAVAKAYADDPDLYDEYQKEVA